MTIETLEQYYGTASNINAINEQLRTMYSSVHSPAPNPSGVHGTEPGDPTARTALRIIALKEQLEQEHLRLLDLAEEIEAWLLTCPDMEIVSIIRWHYLLRLNWKQTNQKVYGYPDYFYARQKVIKYFEKLAKNIKA